MIPASIYKYESLSHQSLENLKAQGIYFGSPLKFNDPYDCALFPNILTLSDQQIDQLRRKYLEDPRISEKARNQLIEASLELLRQSFMSTGHLAVNDLINLFLKSKGVACFSERNDDLLMWSHYGGHYKGFCLEFSTKFEPFEKLRKVTYRKDIPSVDIAPILLTDNDDQILDLFFTKSEAWSYEAEWRVVHNVVGTRYTYPEECLTGVYFGPDISDESMEIICLILGGQNEIVSFWRGHRSKTEFSVLFEKFTYTSYLEAKRKGLL